MAEQLIREDEQLHDRIDLLVERLVDYLSDGAAVAHFKIDQEAVRAVVQEADQVYDGILWGKIGERLSSLHDIDAPLARVIEILKHRPNYSAVIAALGSVERYKALLLDLDNIARAVPQPAERGRGRPPQTEDLRAAVELLVEFWQQQTGVAVKHTGHKKEAFRKDWPPAKKFIFEVIQFIAPYRLDELPGVLEKIVSAN